MPNKLIVANFKYKIPEGAVVVNTTSRSSNWSRGLSPFFVGPIKLYADYESVNMENAWQYSKVYAKHIDASGDPSEKYWEWAKAGWSKRLADRYPMGRGAIPEYSFWDGQKLQYVEARKKIYIPLYSDAVRATVAFETLKKTYEESDILVLQDFDAHNIDVLTFDLESLINNKNFKVGHAYVLSLMLVGKL